MMNSAILLDSGMKYLSEKLGVVEAERLIALLIREPFGYTKWREDNLFIGMSVKEISSEANKYSQAHKQTDIE